MSNSLKENAHAVLIPAFADLRLSDAVRRFLNGGGCSLILGETREEYVARQMTPQRRQEETAESLLAVTEKVNALSGGSLIAVDQEIAGIRRLHDLVPPFPPAVQLHEMSSVAFEIGAGQVAAAARALGINCFLGPILDIVTGDNPWLFDRTWSTDPQIIARMTTAYIRGVQANGVAAAAKHFPGYAQLIHDPAVEPEARLTEPLPVVESNITIFAEAIRQGAAMIMTGPAVVESLDPDRAVSLSPVVIQILREKLGFKGGVLSDDLDSQAILRGSSITRAAVDALNAGVDLLLIADMDDHIHQIVEEIIKAVQNGTLAEPRLAEAAAKVRALVKKIQQLDGGVSYLGVV